MSRNTSSEAFAPWAKAQNDFWERWRAAMAGDTPPMLPHFALWNLPIELWRVAIYEGLDAQLALAETWKAWTCANDANIPELTQGANQAAHFAEDWTRTQMQLWDSWFAALEGAAALFGMPPPEQKHRASRARSHERRHAPVPHAPASNGVPA